MGSTLVSTVTIEHTELEGGQLSVKKCSPRDRAIFLETVYRPRRKAQILESLKMAESDAETKFNELDAFDQLALQDSLFTTLINTSGGPFDLLEYAVNKSHPGKGKLVADLFERFDAMQYAANLFGFELITAGDAGKGESEEAEKRPSEPASSTQ